MAGVRSPLNGITGRIRAQQPKTKGSRNAKHNNTQGTFNNTVRHTYAPVIFYKKVGKRMLEQTIAGAYNVGDVVQVIVCGRVNNYLIIRG